MGTSTLIYNITIYIHIYYMNETQIETFIYNTDVVYLLSQHWNQPVPGRMLLTHRCYAQSIFSSDALLLVMGIGKYTMW